jgi:hypothetical protein
MRRNRIIILGLVLIGALSGCGGGGQPAAGGQLAPASAHFIPYVDVSSASSGLRTQVQQSGVKAVALGFVVAAGQRCQATWGGDTPISDPNVADVSATAPTVVSFGGREGNDLALACTNPSGLADQYERALTAGHATGADFDIERSALRDPGSIERRSRAIAALQAWARRSGRSLSVSLTLPAETSGLPGAALRVVRSAVAAGVHLAHVNLLAFDFGEDKPASAAGQMARYVTATAIHAADQLRGTLPDASGAKVWQAIGITTMIGRNDVASELFTTKDATEVLRFAQAHHVGWLSLWSLSRDRSCPSGVDRDAAQDRCSGLAQPAFQFTQLFASYDG